MNKGEQLVINFDEAAERQQIIKKYKLAGDSIARLNPKGGDWYIGDTQIDKWEEEWNERNVKDGNYGQY